MLDQATYYGLGFGCVGAGKPGGVFPEAAASGRTAGREGTVPRPVSRGAKLHQGAVEVSIDWLRLRGLKVDQFKATEVLQAFFGNYEPGRGRYFFSHSLRFEAGACILFDQERDECIVDLPGSVLSALDGNEQMTLIKGLVLGGFGHATRIDVALDFRGSDLRVVQDVISACRRGELTGARNVEETVTNQGQKGLCVRLGSRGKHGSGRFVRCYDKGLETGEASANQWHRYEVEFSKETAATALTWILQGQVLKDSKYGPIISKWRSWEPTEGWEISAAQCAMGAVDFRQNNGQAALSRRPRSKWWAALLGVVEPTRICCRRVRRACLEATQAWVRKQVMPTVLAMARLTRRSVDRVIEDLAGDMGKIRSAVTPAVFQYELAAMGGVFR